MKGVLGIALGAWCAVVIACAAASKSAMQPAPGPETATHAQPPMPGSPRDEEINRLANEIEAQRVELGLPQPAPPPFTCAGATCPQSAQELAAGVPTPTRECKPTGETCTQACTLADSICSNAKKICDIASQLDGDRWAATKCSDGTQTCKDAKLRCCGCK